MNHLCRICLVAWVATAGFAGEGEPPWQPLFDGKFPFHFRGYKMLQFPVNIWTARTGVLSSVPGGERTDLMLRQKYAHYEFSVEYRLPPGAASGIVYLVQEGAPRAAQGGLKMVLADDERHPEAKNNPLYRTGALFGILPATNAAPKPAGQWNEARVLVRGMHVEHWLNGRLVLQFDLDAESFENALRRSRLRNLPDFKEVGEGYIGLEHPGVEMGFRNPRIRLLPPPDKPEAPPAGQASPSTNPPSASEPKGNSG